MRALSPFCKTVVEHADAAIGTALGNDVRIAFTVSTLRTVDLDSTLLAKAHGTEEIRRAFVAIRGAAVRAEAQTRQVRTDAKLATDPDQKAELTAFADALEGAAVRQRKLADELGRYVAYLDSHPPINEDDQARQAFELQLAESQFMTPIKGDPRDYLPWTLSELARDAADTLTVQTQDIAADEGTAAQHADPAFARCR